MAIKMIQVLLDNNSKYIINSYPLICNMNKKTAPQK